MTVKSHTRWLLLVLTWYDGDYDDLTLNDGDYTTGSLTQWNPPYYNLLVFIGQALRKTKRTHEPPPPKKKKKKKKNYTNDRLRHKRFLIRYSYS